MIQMRHPYGGVRKKFRNFNDLPDYGWRFPDKLLK